MCNMVVTDFFNQQTGQAVVILVGFMIADYITGLISAFIHNDLSSRIGIKGLFRKVEYFLMVILSITCDYAVTLLTNYNTHNLCCYVIITWFVINELLSIIENMAEIGVPIPVFIVRRLKEIKDKLNEGEIDSNDKYHF